MKPTPRQATTAWIRLFVATALLAPGIAFAQQEEEERGKLRSEVEAELPPIEAAYRAAPGDDGNRRAYAEILYKLGNMWEANDVIAPLATTSSSNTDDLKLGADLAYVAGDYGRAEGLFDRLSQVADEGSEAHSEALEGLVMVYYQTDRYARVREIELPDDERPNSLLAFMKKFEGEPNRIDWATDERVAHLPMINDYNQPGVLPLFRLEVNGHPVEFILDTGGDRLYIDEKVAERVGIRHVHERQARYAYTKGEYVDEPLGVADSVTMGEVTLRNVPVIVAKWKAMGPTSDGVVTTQMLKQFLSTVDYDKGEITFRERSERGKQQLLDSFEGDDPVRMPFWMAASHLQFTKGSINDRQGLNMFMDSGLALSMPMVVVDETAEVLGIADEKTELDVEGYDLYWVPIESHGIGSLTRGATQAVGNIFVEANTYWNLGFLFDALMSHEYIRHLGSWTIDFDTMSYYFPAVAVTRSEESLRQDAAATLAADEEFEVANPDDYVGSYEIAPGVALEITAEDGVVFLQAPGQQRVGMEAVGEDTFLIRLAGATVTFERDDSGTIAALVLDQGGNQTRGTRK